ncbi:MAG: cytochrome c [Gammaproteobacteria bacterium]|nr:cytochrome c [Gammaproteobacteria bacterium]NIR96775.1 cytochrome c [Gammaproteobacteria bacterium]NIT62480.1 cytochrome c [Gammaproteobacteria bacterium]NIV19415.1 hypothetical protein [Gammaproteobacteria bacterium]NIX10503.1 hypothetical protein [Gammaproteobacteria bacterium]
MRTANAVVPQTALLAAALGIATATQAVVPASQALFDRPCASCHRGPASLNTPPHAVAEVLDKGVIRAHRLSLSGEQIQDLTEYLNEVRSSQEPES